MRRRGFLGMLAAIGLVKVAPEPPAWNVVDLPVEPEVFVGSFRVGELTRRHGCPATPSLIKARIEETVRELGAQVDRTHASRGGGTPAGPGPSSRSRGPSART